MAVQVESMPRKKADAPEAHQGQAAKVHIDVLKMARAIVGIKGGSVTDLISSTCRPVFIELIKEMQKRGEFLPKPD